MDWPGSVTTIQSRCLICSWRPCQSITLTNLMSRETLHYSWLTSRDQEMFVDHWSREEQYWALSTKLVSTYSTIQWLQNSFCSDCWTCWPRSQGGAKEIVVRSA